MEVGAVCPVALERDAGVEDEKVDFGRFGLGWSVSFSYMLIFFVP